MQAQWWPEPWQILHRLGYIPNFKVRMDLELLRPMDDALTDSKVRMA
jgi:hypothetical protein